MENLDRAKQFMAFDALDGFYKTIHKKEFVKDTPIYLAEDEIEKINELFCTLQSGDNISVKYYCNQKYVIKVGIIKSIDNYKKMIKFTDESIIRFREIVNISIIS